jgi:hypothetical protein
MPQVVARISPIPNPLLSLPGHFIQQKMVYGRTSFYCANKKQLKKEGLFMFADDQTGLSH